MTTFELRVIVTTSESVSEKELIDFVMFQLGGRGSLPLDNPFISEDSEAEIERVDVF
jgi:hypothetical protein